MTFDSVKAENAYGLVVRVENADKLAETMRAVDAEHRAEVRIEIDDEVHEYTMADFKARLGFGAEGA